MKIEEWLPFSMIYRMTWTFIIITPKIRKVKLSSNEQCIHPIMSLFLFFKNVIHLCMELSKTTEFIIKGEFYIVNNQKLSLAFSHCLCGCWCQGTNLWPYQILAWMTVVCLFEQHRSWYVQPFQLQNQQLWKVLKIQLLRRSVVD